MSKKVDICHQRLLRRKELAELKEKLTPAFQDALNTYKATKELRKIARHLLSEASMTLRVAQQVHKDALAKKVYAEAVLAAAKTGLAAHRWMVAPAQTKLSDAAMVCEITARAVRAAKNDPLYVVNEEAFTIAHNQYIAAKISLKK
jgi:hypothetical protein